MNRSRKSRAFTLVEIMIVVLLIGILMAIAVPNFLRAREDSRKSTCIANLRQIDSAKDQWAMDKKKVEDDLVEWSDLTGPSGYLSGPATGPVCPSDGIYALNAVDTDPTCTKSALGHTLPQPRAKRPKKPRI
jgi:prepilin-type N-terminal cleavage/methylation domain-containing protein